MDVFWFLPTHGDGHYLGTTQGARPVTLNYLKQVAQAADDLGYHGVLIPTGRSCEDSWVIASALVPLTERLRYLVAIRPGIISPTVSARMAATLDRLSGGLDGALAAYYQAYAFSLASRDDFETCISQATGEDIRPLLRDYLDTYILH